MHPLRRWTIDAVTDGLLLRGEPVAADVVREVVSGNGSAVSRGEPFPFSFWSPITVGTAPEVGEKPSRPSDC